uniref:Uncharacterized protein n=1 Tax=Anguilla anguilla TaxID=7936 RepID=A0A0E9RX13_ANGAN
MIKAKLAKPSSWAKTEAFTLM